MTWQDGYIAVDWGTTNRRAWRIGSSGETIDALSDDLGLLAVPAGGFPTAATAIRQRLGNLPMLLAGMVGSNRGWVEAPYVPCPAGVEALAGAIEWIEPGRTGIVPGVRQSSETAPDVMRGEEVQVLGGLALGLTPSNGLVCHPGTHTKWITVEQSRIARFQTMMTGEFFNLLRTHSILAPQLEADVRADDSFMAGVAAANGGTEVLPGLFGVRAGFLLGSGAPKPASFASGLLIGNDVRAAVTNAGRIQDVVLIGRPDLCALYEAALATHRVASREVDGAQAFLAGIRLITELL